MPKGRPAISGEAKNRLLQIRLTDGELAAITGRAVKAGKGVATYARDLLLADAMAGKSAAAKRK